MEKKEKEYDYNDNVEFEGEYLNGKRNGNGKEYSNIDLVFEWEYLNNNRIKGKEFIKKKLVYD